METGRWELVQEDVFVVFKVVRDGEGNVRAESLVFVLSVLVFFFKYLDSLSYYHVLFIKCSHKTP